MRSGRTPIAGGDATCYPDMVSSRVVGLSCRGEASDAIERRLRPAVRMVHRSPPIDPKRSPTKNACMKPVAIMTPNAYEPPMHDSPRRCELLPSWSTRARVFFLLASLPAGLLPIAYFVCAGWMVIKLTDVLAFSHRPPAIDLLIWIAIYATYVQLPIYMLWTLLSRELTIRQRLIWFILVFLGNMLAIPVFLYAKYRNKTKAWITRPVRPF